MKKKKSKDHKHVIVWTWNTRILTDYAQKSPRALQYRVQETFELHQLKSAPFNFYRFFFQDLTGCKLVAINLDWPISYIFFKCRLISSSL